MTITPAQITMHVFKPIRLLVDRPSGAAVTCSEMRVPFFIHLALPTATEVSV